MPLMLQRAPQTPKFILLIKQINKKGSGGERGGRVFLLIYPGVHGCPSCAPMPRKEDSTERCLLGTFTDKENSKRRMEDGKEDRKEGWSERGRGSLMPFLYNSYSRQKLNCTRMLVPQKI